ncbi:hypothetical protein TH468_09455 [Thalassospira sp. MCCC 1A03138]|nr:hypothetical protein TH468_09455 [Thalassospira sp. MCCC 1A03138]
MSAGFVSGGFSRFGGGWQFAGLFADGEREGRETRANSTLAEIGFAVTCALRVKSTLLAEKCGKDWQFVDKSANKIPKVIMHSKK